MLGGVVHHQGQRAVWYVGGVLVGARFSTKDRGAVGCKGSSGVGLGQESYPKRSHSGDGWVSHLKCKPEVQMETQTSAVSQELSAEALGEWKERKLSSERHQVCLLSSEHAVSVVHVEPLILPPYYLPSSFTQPWIPTHTY